jgi:hypothetical protein
MITPVDPVIRITEVDQFLYGGWGTLIFRKGSTDHLLAAFSNIILDLGRGMKRKPHLFQSDIEGICQVLEGIEQSSIEVE